VGDDDAGKSCNNSDLARLRDCVCSGMGATNTAAIMAKAYGTVLIVLSTGFVAFVLMVSYMAFEHPEKAKIFLDNFAGPAAALLLAYSVKAAHEYFSRSQSKS
jgi:hypothetical protein